MPKTLIKNGTLITEAETLSADLLIEGIQKWTGRQDDQEDDITVIIVDVK